MYIYPVFSISGIFNIRYFLISGIIIIIKYFQIDLLKNRNFKNHLFNLQI